MLKRLLPNIFTNNTLLNSQFDFSPAHSIIHQVYRLVNAMSFFLEKTDYYACIFLDISQAFDRVWYECLLFRLNKCTFSHYTCFLQNVPIPMSNMIRYLGFNLDKRLTWNTHIRIKRLALNDSLDL